MVELHLLYVAILASATSLALVLAFLALRYRHSTNVAVPFAVMMFGHAAWSSSLAFVWASRAPAQQFFFRWLAEVSSLVLAVGFFVVALFVARMRIELDTKRLLAVSVFPAVLVILMPFNPGAAFRTGSTAERVGSFTLFVPRPGIAYWLLDIGIYALVGIGLFLVMRVAFSSRGVRRTQAAMLLFGWAVPFFSSFAFESGYRPLGSFDPAPVAFLVAGTIWFVALLHGRLLDITPLARDVLVEHMEEGFIVLDASGRIVDANRTAEELVGLASRDPGSGNHEVLQGLDGIADLDHEEDSAGSILLRLGDAGERRYIDCTVKPLGVGLGDPDAHLVVLHDVTELKHKQHELECLNEELHAKLDEISALKDQLRDQAIRDPLTRLYNRRFLEESLQREKARAERSGTPVALIMVDIDHFKHVNDTYSHQAGDEALRSLADMLSSKARAGDVVCRYGGEEFVMVMPGLSEEAAVHRAEELRKRIERTPIEFDGSTFDITVSVGVSLLHPDLTPEDDIHAADIALYAAKETGRNRTILVGTPSTPVVEVSDEQYPSHRVARARKE